MIHSEAKLAILLKINIKMELIDYNHDAVRGLLRSKYVVYEYLASKGNFLDPIESKAMSKKFLDGLLKGLVWAPSKNTSSNWSTQK